MITIEIMEDGRILLKSPKVWRIAKTVDDIPRKLRLLLRDIELGVDLNG